MTFYRRGMGRVPYTIHKRVLTDFTDAECALDVRVIAARSPFSFVVHRADKVFNLAEIEQEIAEIYLDLDNRYPEIPYPYDIRQFMCYSLYSQKKRRWVRARATENIMYAHQMQRNTTFELVDYFDTEVVPANYARYLPDEMCVLPEMGYKMRIDEIIPNPWPNRASDCAEFRNTVLGKEFYCIPEHQDEDETYRVNLYDVPKDEDDMEFRDFNETNMIRALPASAYRRTVSDRYVPSSVQAPVPNSVGAPVPVPGPAPIPYFVPPPAVNGSGRHGQHPPPAENGNGLRRQGPPPVENGSGLRRQDPPSAENRNGVPNSVRAPVPVPGPAFVPFFIPLLAMNGSGRRSQDPPPAENGNGRRRQDLPPAENGNGRRRQDPPPAENGSGVPNSVRAPVPVPGPALVPYFFPPPAVNGSGRRSQDPPPAENGNGLRRQGPPPSGPSNPYNPFFQ